MLMVYGDYRDYSKLEDFLRESDIRRAYRILFEGLTPNEMEHFMEVAHLTFRSNHPENLREINKKLKSAKPGKDAVKVNARAFTYPVIFDRFSGKKVKRASVRTFPKEGKTVDLFKATDEFRELAFNEKTRRVGRSELGDILVGCQTLARWKLNEIFRPDGEKPPYNLKNFSKEFAFYSLAYQGALKMKIPLPVMSKGWLDAMVYILADIPLHWNAPKSGPYIEMWPVAGPNNGKNKVVLKRLAQQEDKHEAYSSWWKFRPVTTSFEGRGNPHQGDADEHILTRSESAALILAYWINETSPGHKQFPPIEEFKKGGYRMPGIEPNILNPLTSWATRASFMYRNGLIVDEEYRQEHLDHPREAEIASLMFADIYECGPDKIFEADEGYKSFKTYLQRFKQVFAQAKFTELFDKLKFIAQKD